MASGGNTVDGVDERIAFIERNWMSVRGSRRRKPRFWHDVDVRRFLIAEHGFLTIDMAITQARARFGDDRAPSRSAIGRFWQTIDAMVRHK